jgi:hypothetical protein
VCIINVHVIINEILELLQKQFQYYFELYKHPDEALVDIFSHDNDYVTK